ncbi:hypothetical protein WS75_30045 [Burkholderia sp. FL-7-2-10-S1-D7]|nr:hypothetical protein WS75_30045 [Burkholderia sp. FL-7-2-10-S1-D7]
MLQVERRCIRSGTKRILTSPLIAVRLMLIEANIGKIVGLLQVQLKTEDVVYDSIDSGALSSHG